MAPPAWRRIDFISDLHLAEDTPRTFAAWRDYLLNTRADAVFVLGDLFEAWVGDDARFEGFEAAAAAVLTKAAALRPIAFMVGNRDFLLGRAMLAACGIDALPDPIVLCAFDQRALLSHGDAWCLADTDYQRFRREVRDPAWQARILAKPLAERRALARSIRSESERKAAEHQGEWADVDAPTAIDGLMTARATTLVHGHTHRPATEALAPTLVRHVLSDWDLDHADRAQVLRWQDGVWARLTPAAAVA
ncbi:MAG: UDP-2,3-diacylglucosamine diphosphatase [Burkholderiales bacterium]